MHGLPVAVELLLCNVGILAEENVEAEVWLLKGTLRAVLSFCSRMQAMRGGRVRTYSTGRPYVRM